MPKEMINGILVDFPFTPYEVQRVFMHSVIEALNNNHHAVLESPTGTGKTLSLLCSVISWVERYKKQNLEKQKGEDFPCNMKKIRIFYTSRTHSQLSKVMTELKTTSYKNFKVTILGSRDQLCIHPTVSKETSLVMKNLYCKMHSKNKSCHYGNRVETCQYDKSFDGMVDIEDLISKSKKLSCCPYYLARELQRDADIIFLPYNYLFDYNMRRNLKIDLDNSIVIVDEAHNINRVCEDSASVSLLSSDVALALSEVTQEMEAMFKDQHFHEYSLERDYNQDDLCTIKEILLKLEKVIDTLEFQGDGRSATHIGSYIFKIFKNADIDENSCNMVISLLSKISDTLAVAESGTGRKGIAIKKLADIISTVFAVSTSDKSIADKFFKVYVESDTVTKAPPLNTWDSLDLHANRNAKKVNFWCFNSGFGMAKLLDCGVRTFIFTSGTLAPLPATIRELNLEKPISLESPHIIKSEQVLVSVVGKGPTDVELRSCYNNRDNDQYWNEIGLSLLNYLRLIPDGVLVFFPSYSALNKAVDNWRSTGLWAKLNSMKPMYVESTRKNEFNEMINGYKQSVAEGNGRGAVLIGVCRGKVSEGIDFINEYGRAVIICGLPYPPLLDPRVKLKKAYLDYPNRTAKLMSGDLWYQLEATRAVNQAIGRVIRHADDFATILLCDVKFSQKSIIENLSKWLRPLVTIKPFGLTIQSISKFFNVNSFRSQPKIEFLGREDQEDIPEAGLSLPSTSRQNDRLMVNSPEVALPENSQMKVNRRMERQSCFALLEDETLEETESRNSRPCAILDGIKNATIINPAKKRKIIIQPLMFDDYCSGTTKAAVDYDKKLNEAKNFLCQMKTTLDEESYTSFSKIMRTFHNDSNFEVMITQLTALFPVCDPAYRKMLLDCKKLLSGPHLKKFEEFCERHSS